MLPYFIVILSIIVLIVIWAISTQCRLVVLDENINNAMNQIGVQMSSRFDALIALLKLTKGYGDQGCETLIETIKARRSMISAKSKPNEVLRQEGIISEALASIAILIEKYPQLKTDQTYIKTMDAVHTYENMVRTSCLIYNDSVNKLNRVIRMLPVSIIAGVFGFRRREYLVDKTDKEAMPSIM